jgi:hydroxyacylglutathione hydrolase
LYSSAKDTLLNEIEPRPLSIDEAIPYFQRGAALLDTRSKEEYVEAHVPGSTYIFANEKLGERIGAVLPRGVQIVLLIGTDQDYAEIVRSLAQAGYENIAGYLNGGIAAWEAEGLPTSSGDVEDINVNQLQDMLQSDPALQVVDVRESWEFRMGHVPDALLMPLGELHTHIDELDPDQPVILICATGVRSLSAAALLGRSGFSKMYNVAGGTHAWVDAGFPVERG